MALYCGLFLLFLVFLSKTFTCVFMLLYVHFFFRFIFLLQLLSNHAEALYCMNFLGSELEGRNWITGINLHTKETACKELAQSLYHL